ncbi:MAG: RagB/SusD family nutrient uptake outer membrane protein [Gemmatimonadaceae bacterium]|nr:RagB/SusD family nutrient uptake outer membrane protein [Gemmatimonadaceae bacterium]
MHNLTRKLSRVLVPGALLLGAVAGCHSLVDLDEKPQTFIDPTSFYRSAADARAAVNGVYAALAGPWGFDAFMTIMCDDNEMTCWNWMSGGWTGHQSPSYVWTADYQAIHRANDIIAQVPGAAGIDSATRRVAIAQAKFGRAYAYFDLVRRYGGVPLRTTPYKQESTLGDMPRASYAQVYGQVTADLKAAGDSLPKLYNGAYNGGALPTKASAYGLLAKVYLEMAGHSVDTTTLNGKEAIYNDSALWAARMVRTVGGVQLDQRYMDVFNVSDQNSDPEILFSIQEVSNTNNSTQIPQYFGPIGDCTRVGGCGLGFMELRPEFYETFDSTDKRVEHNVAIAFSWTQTNHWRRNPLLVLYDDSLQTLKAKGLVPFDSMTWDGGWDECGASFMHPTHKVTLLPGAIGNADTVTTFVGVSKPLYSLKYLDPNYPGTYNPIILRYADVLLVHAEAANEVNGPTAEAYAAIDSVRTRAGLPKLTPGLTQAQFRDSVWTERSHELYGEFQARFDLIREGRWLTVMNRAVPSTVKHTGYYSTYPSYGVCHPRAAYQFLQPIPNTELAANQAITQNVGW